MKFTLGWLKDHLDTDAAPDEIGDALTALGLELESITDRAKEFAAFKVALVETAEKHPDADRLKVLTVDTGAGRLQVVCGAPNARAGMKGIFAPDGSFIPGTGVTLKKGVIRGQESNGMMVSEREMGLSDAHEGIIEVDGAHALGTPFADVYGLNDPVFDIAVTPNRADCAGVRGIARDLAAAGIGRLKPLDETPVAGSFRNPVPVTSETGDCPHFLGRMVRNVRNGPSPAWLQARLKAVGLRPISSLVDITNYLSLDLCRPLHVFDADRLSGGLAVRAATGGEPFAALNDKDYALGAGMVAVYDARGAVALGGVMGGRDTAVSDATTNVYIECAYFDPNRTARTGRALEINSDARYRFERGIDPAFTATGMEIATRMVIDLCGGEASDVAEAGAAPDMARTYPFDPAYTEKLTGVRIDAGEQARILTALGFEVADGAAVPPSWRGDIDGRADLVEEIVRVHGYDSIPALSVRSEAAVPEAGETDNFARARRARTALAARGLFECVTWSFMKRENAALFGSDDNPALALSNPISSELSQMRPSILPNLIEAAQKNADRGLADAALFEVGPAFSTAEADGQVTVAAGVRAGNRGARHWSGAEASRAVDALDAKADALCALEAAGVPVANLQVSRDAPGYYHPGRSGSLRLGNRVLAYFGELHPQTSAALGAKGAFAAFEAFINGGPAIKKRGTARTLLSLSAFQPVMRDFAFLAPDALDADAIARAARGADKMIERIDVFDVYRGKGVEDGHKSVAINVVIQPKDKTLGDEEIEAICKKIVDAVTAKTGATLRS